MKAAVYVIYNDKDEFIDVVFKGEFGMLNRLQSPKYVEKIKKEYLEKHPELKDITVRVAETGDKRASKDYQEFLNKRYQMNEQVKLEKYKLICEKLAAKESIVNEATEEEEQLAAVNKDGYAIEYIKNPSEEVQLAAVNKNGYAIRDIKNPTEKVQLAAINQNDDAFKYIKNPSEKVQLAAVNKNGTAIEYIFDKGIIPSEDVQLAAVNKEGYAIYFIIKNGIVPSEKVQLAAVNEDSNAIYFIIKKDIIPSEEVQLAAVNNFGYAIQYIKNPSEKVKQLARDKGY